MANLQIKRKLAEGKPVTIVGGHPTNSHMVDFLGQFGFDGIWIECEHGPVTWDQIGDLSRACDVWNTASIVRIPTSEPWIITRTLDQGASGIIVPHISTADEARRVAEAAKFAPLGDRGIYTGCRRSFGVGDYFNHANEETLVGILIEEAEAIENLSEILKVPNIDVFSVAPNDLAQSMGHVGDWKHPEVMGAIEQAIGQIVDAGKTAGFLAEEAELQRYYDLGVRWFHSLWPRWVAASAQRFLGSVGAIAG